MCGFVFSSEVVAIVQAFENNHFGALVLLCLVVAVLAIHAWHRDRALLPRRMLKAAAKKKRKARQR
jgi:hypothetical protein